MSGGIQTQIQMCVLHPQLHSWPPALGQERIYPLLWAISCPEVQATIPGGFDIWSQSGERKASSPHVIPFHQRLFEKKCRRKLKSKQTKNYQGNKAQAREDKGKKCLEKHFPLWQVSVMYRKPVRNTEPVTAETSQREQCVWGEHN